MLTKLVNSFIEAQRMGFLVAVFPAKPKNEIVKNQVQIKCDPVHFHYTFSTAWST